MNVPLPSRLILTFIYTCIHQYPSDKRGIRFGLLAGLFMGMPALGSYAHLPIPLTISLLWMLDAILAGLGAGMVIAAVYREKII
ncbi:MAG: hypothetical protein MI673_09005 [Thiotrichales bacterium]|nr:hypothetical protein [Thiotrichales bacterium]